MFRSKSFVPAAIALGLLLSGPAGAQDDPALCANDPGFAIAIESLSRGQTGGCPKVQVFSVNGYVGTACVLYLSEDKPPEPGPSPRGATLEGQVRDIALRAHLAY